MPKLSNIAYILTIKYLKFMFKGHPKGLYALALANTGERFGYYTMLAVFAWVLYILCLSSVVSWPISLALAVW